MGQQGGAVFVEKLIAYLPVLLFFFATWQIGEMLVAKLVLTRASSAAARAAAVVLPDDPHFYDSVPVHVFEGKRKDDIKLATAMILAASPHFDENFDVEIGEIPVGFGALEITVSAHFHCSILPLACGVDGVVPMKQKIVQPYHGAAYKYEFGGCAFDDPCGGVIDMYDQFGAGWTAAGVAGLAGTQLLQGGGNQCAAGNGGNANPPSGSTGPLPGPGPTGPGATPGGTGPGSFTPGGGGTPPGRGDPGSITGRGDPGTPGGLDPGSIPPKIDPSTTPGKTDPNTTPSKTPPTTTPGKTDPNTTPSKTPPTTTPGKTDPNTTPSKTPPTTTPGKTDPNTTPGKTDPNTTPSKTPPTTTPSKTPPTTTPSKTPPTTTPGKTDPNPLPGTTDPNVASNGKTSPNGSTPKSTPTHTSPTGDVSTSNPGKTPVGSTTTKTGPGGKTPPLGDPPDVDPNGTSSKTTADGTSASIDPSAPTTGTPGKTNADGSPLGPHPNGPTTNTTTPGGSPHHLDPSTKNPSATPPQSVPGGDKNGSGTPIQPPGSGAPIGSGRPDRTVVGSDLPPPGPTQSPGKPSPTFAQSHPRSQDSGSGGREVPPGTGRPSRTFVEPPARPGGDTSARPGGSAGSHSDRSTDQLGRDVDGNPIDPGKDAEGPVSQGNEPDYEAHGPGQQSHNETSADGSDTAASGDKNGGKDGDSPSPDAKANQQKNQDGDKQAGVDKDRAAESPEIASSFKDQICTFCADSGRPHRELFSAFQQRGPPKEAPSTSDFSANTPGSVRPSPDRISDLATSVRAPRPNSSTPILAQGGPPQGIFGAPSTSLLRSVPPTQVNTKIGSSNCGFCSVAGTLPARISSSELARRVQMNEGGLTPTELITVMLKVGSGDGRFSLHTDWADAQNFIKKYPDGTPDSTGKPTEPTVFIVSYNPPSGALGHDLTAEFRDGKITFRDYQNFGTEFTHPNTHMLTANGGFIQITPVNNTKTGPGQDNSVGPVLNEGDLSQAQKDHLADLLLETDANGTKPTYDELIAAYFDAYDAKDTPGPLGPSPTPPPQPEPSTSSPRPNQTFDDILADIGQPQGRAENDAPGTTPPKKSFFKNLFRKKPKASSGQSHVSGPGRSDASASRDLSSGRDNPRPYGALENDAHSDYLKRRENFRDFLLTRKDALNDSGGYINGRNLNSGDLSSYIRNCTFTTIGGTLPRKITSSEAARISNMKEGGVNQFDIVTAMLRNGLGDGRVAYHTDWTHAQDFMKKYPGGQKTNDGSVQSTKFVIAYFDPKRGGGHTLAGKVKDGTLTFRDYQDSGLKFHSPDTAMNDALSNGGYVMIAPVGNFTPVRPGEEIILNEKDLSRAQKELIGNLTFKPEPGMPAGFERVKNKLKIAKIQGLPRIDTGAPAKDPFADPDGSSPSDTDPFADPDSAGPSPSNASDPFADPDSSAPTYGAPIESKDGTKFNWPPINHHRARPTPEQKLRISQSPRFVYRKLRPGEDVEKGLIAQRPFKGSSDPASRDVFAHVNDGASDKWISTSSNIGKLEARFRQTKMTSKAGEAKTDVWVRIDLAKTRDTLTDVIDLSSQSNRDKWFSGHRGFPTNANAYARESAEVLIEGTIRPEAITVADTRTLFREAFESGSPFRIEKRLGDTDLSPRPATSNLSQTPRFHIPGYRIPKKSDVKARAEGGVEPAQQGSENSTAPKRARDESPPADQSSPGNKRRKEADFDAQKPFLPEGADKTPRYVYREAKGGELEGIQGREREFTEQGRTFAKGHVRVVADPSLLSGKFPVARIDLSRAGSTVEGIEVISRSRGVFELNLGGRTLTPDAFDIGTLGQARAHHQEQKSHGALQTLAQALTNKSRSDVLETQTVQGQARPTPVGIDSLRERMARNAKYATFSTRRALTMARHGGRISAKSVNSGNRFNYQNNCSFASIAGSLPSKITSSEVARRSQMVEGSLSAKDLITTMLRNGAGDGRTSAHTNWNDAQTFMRGYPSGTKFIVSYYHRPTADGGIAHSISGKFKNGTITFRDYQQRGKKDRTPNAHMNQAIAILITPVNNTDAGPPALPGQDAVINASSLSDAQKNQLIDGLYLPDPGSTSSRPVFTDFIRSIQQGQRNAQSPGSRTNSSVSSTNTSLRPIISRRGSDASTFSLRTDSDNTSTRAVISRRNSDASTISRSSHSSNPSMRALYSLPNADISAPDGSRNSASDDASTRAIISRRNSNDSSQERATNATSNDSFVTAKTSPDSDGAGSRPSSPDPFADFDGVHFTENGNDSARSSFTSHRTGARSRLELRRHFSALGTRIRSSFRRMFRLRRSTTLVPGAEGRPATSAQRPAVLDNNAMETGRTLNEYETIRLAMGDVTGPSLRDALNELGPDHTWADMGAGEAVALRNFARTFQEQPGNMPGLIALAMDRPQLDALNQFQDTHADKFKYLEGKLEEFDNATISENRLDLITDVLGVASYTPDLKSTIQRYAELLNPGKHAFITIEKRYGRNTFVNQATGKNEGPAEWLSQATGVDVAVKEWSAEWHVRLTRNDDPIYIPPLEATSFTAGYPPVRVFGFESSSASPEFHQVEASGDSTSKDQKGKSVSTDPTTNAPTAPPRNNRGRPDPFIGTTSRVPALFAQAFAKRARRTENNILREIRDKGLTEAHAQALIDKMNGDQDFQHARVIANQVEARSETLVERLSDEDKKNAIRAVANYVTSHKALQDNANITPDTPSIAVQDLDKALRDLHGMMRGDELNVVYRSITYEDASNIPYGQLVSREARRIEGYDSKIGGYRIDEGDFVSDPGFLSTSEHRQFVLTKEQNATNRIKPTLKLAIVGKSGTPIAFDPSEGHANILPYLNRTESRRYSLGPDGRGLTLARRLSDRFSGEGPRPGQAEVLFPRNTVFQVRKIQRDGDHVSVVLEEVSSTNGAEVKRLEYGTLRSLNRARMRRQRTDAGRVHSSDGDSITPLTSSSAQRTDAAEVRPAGTSKSPGDAPANRQKTAADRSKRRWKPRFSLPRKEVETGAVSQANRDGGLSDESAQKLIDKMKSEVAANHLPRSGDAEYSKIQSKLPDEVTSNLKFTAIDPRGKRAQKASTSLDVEGWDQFRRVDEAIQKTLGVSSKNEGRIVYHSDPSTSLSVYEGSIQPGDHVGRGDYQYLSTLHDASASVHLAFYAKSGVPLPKNSWDRHFIFPRNTFFQVRKIERSGDKIFVALEEASGPRPQEVKDLGSGETLAPPSGQRFQQWLALTKARLDALNKTGSPSNLPGPSTGAPDPSTSRSGPTADPTRAPTVPDASKQAMWESLQHYRNEHLSRNEGRITRETVNSGDVHTFLYNCLFCTVGGSARPMRTSTAAARLAALSEKSGASGWRNMHAFRENGLGDGRAKWFSGFEAARAFMANMPAGTLFGVNYWRSEPGHGPVGHTISAEHTPNGVVFTDYQISRVFKEPTPGMGAGQAFQIIPLNNLDHMQETNPDDPAFVNEADLSTSDRRKILETIYGPPFLERSFGQTYDVGRVWAIFKQKYHPPAASTAENRGQKRPRPDPDDSSTQPQKRTSLAETIPHPETGASEARQITSESRPSSASKESQQVFGSWNDATNYLSSVPDNTKVVIVPLGTSKNGGRALTAEVNGGRLSLLGNGEDPSPFDRFQEAESILVAPIENQAAFCGR